MRTFLTAVGLVIALGVAGCDQTGGPGSAGGPTNRGVGAGTESGDTAQTTGPAGTMDERAAGGVTPDGVPGTDTQGAAGADPGVTPGGPAGGGGAGPGATPGGSDDETTGQ